LARSDEAAWSDLEQAFFASAPPDNPEPPPDPEPLDDLFPPAPAHGRAALVRASLVSFASDVRRKGALALDLSHRAGRRTTVAVASVVLVLAFSVGVVASRSGARAIAAPSPAATPAMALAADGAEVGAPGAARSSSELRARHHKSSKRPARHRRRSTGSSSSSSRTSIASRPTGHARSR